MKLKAVYKKPRITFVLSDHLLLIICNDLVHNAIKNVKMFYNKKQTRVPVICFGFGKEQESKNKKKVINSLVPFTKENRANTRNELYD